MEKRIFYIVNATRTEPLYSATDPGLPPPPPPPLISAKNKALRDECFYFFFTPIATPLLHHQ